jgi:carbonic anhydrase
MNKVKKSALKALQILRDGNERFVENDRSIDTYLSHTKLDGHLMGQAPYAIVLGCSDSRVPIEIIFDAGLGDLFVIRVAGNIVAPSLIGSIELAAENFGPRLVIVLGHTGCGAVEFTLQTLTHPETESSRHINAIVEAIRPSVEGLLTAQSGASQDELMDAAVRANVRASATQLRHGSATLERLIKDDNLLIIGAVYSLETGVVQFFDGLSKDD